MGRVTFKPEREMMLWYITVISNVEFAIASLGCDYR
jgi:hypothetical protein